MRGRFGPGELPSAVEPRIRSGDARSAHHPLPGSRHPARGRDSCLPLAFRPAVSVSPPDYAAGPARPRPGPNVIRS